jgi:predicted enzyme related to lactoylglutathione lyase
MSEFTEYAPGTPCWVDVTSPELDRTLSFYSDLFGWEAEQDPRPEVVQDPVGAVFGVVAA